MKDSGVKWIGEIPKDWNLSKIGSYFIERNEKVSDLDYEPLSVTKGGVVPQLETVAKSSDHNNRKLVLKGDFVINSRSDRKMSAGLAYSNGSVSVINTVIYSNTMSKEYTKYLLKNYSFAEEFYRWGSGIVADLWSTRWDKMKNISIPVPAITEQEKIAKKLDTLSNNINNIINETKLSIEELKKYKQSIITEAVTKGLDPNVEMKDSGIEWIGKVPVNWFISNLGRISTLSSGGTPASGNSQYYDGDIPWVRSLDLKEQKIFSTDRNLSEQGLSVISGGMVKKGTIVIAMYGGSGTIGNSGLLEIDASTNQAICSIKLHQEYSNRFYFYFIQFLRPYWMIYAAGTRKDPNISKQIVQKMPCVIPTVEEQGRIASYLDEQTSKIGKLIEDKEKVIEELENYKKSLIYEYVTGKKEV
ncbi:restriction endonuclease subunit S [Priestia flexa]|uniref:restriction endonuclease subunit S n=1 Tax=Priestia flexa TaxID=86664 RepID=UPI001C93B5EE|nr:restriction endonuclease subunit S [Priestia flexa]MBY6086829.1 restriction endonuclease subunit S [Priestia flexa]